MANSMVKPGQLVVLCKGATFSKLSTSSDVNNDHPKDDDLYLLLDQLGECSGVSWLLKIGQNRNDFCIGEWMNHEHPTHMPFSHAFNEDSDAQFNDHQKARIHNMGGSGIIIYDSKLGDIDRSTIKCTQPYLKFKTSSSSFGPFGSKSPAHDCKYLELTRIFEVDTAALDFTRYWSGMHCPILEHSSLRLVKHSATPAICQMMSVTTSLYTPDLSPSSSSWHQIHWFDPNKLENESAEEACRLQTTAAFALILCLDGDDTTQVYISPVSEKQESRPHSYGQTLDTRIQFSFQRNESSWGLTSETCNKTVDPSNCYCVPLSCLRVIPSCSTFHQLTTTESGRQKIPAVAAAAVKKIISFKRLREKPDTIATQSIESPAHHSSLESSLVSHARKPEIVFGTKQYLVSVSSKKTSFSGKNTVSSNMSKEIKPSQLGVKLRDRMEGSVLQQSCSAPPTGSTSVKSVESCTSSPTAHRQQAKPATAWVLGPDLETSQVYTTKDYEQVERSDTSYDDDWSDTNQNEIGQDWDEGVVSNEDDVF